jgi:transposase
LDKLELWKKSIAQNGITAFDPFLKMVESKQEYVLNYVLDHLSNVVTEGCNNVVRAIRRAAFGMTNFQNLRWRVLAAQSILH